MSVIHGTSSIFKGCGTVLTLVSLTCVGCRLDLAGKDYKSNSDTASSPSNGDDDESKPSRPRGTLDLCSIEAHANDSAATAIPIEVGVPTPACIGSATDLDFYVVKAPAEDLAGGYFTVAVTNVGASGIADIHTYLDTDNAAVLRYDYGNNAGGPTYGYWAAAPGQTYRVSIGEFARWTEPWTYILQVDYTRVDDPFEPNDTRDEAKPLGLGVPAEGYLVTGYKVGTIAPEQFDDWFELDLTPGPVTFKVTNYPRDAIAMLGMIDPMGVAIRPGPTPYAANRGADLTASAQVTAAGKYKLRLSVFSDPPSTSGKTDMAEVVPDSFERPYELLVTQP